MNAPALRTAIEPNYDWLATVANRRRNATDPAIFMM